MGETDDPPPLTAWAFGTFHAATLAVVLVLLGHADGGLGDALAGLDTLTGIALYLYLWGLTWLVTRRSLADAGVGAEESSGVGRALRSGMLGGVVAGVAFLLGAILVVFVPRVLFSGPYLPLLLITAIGSVVAAVVGSAIGGLFALLDIGLLAVADGATERVGETRRRL